MAGASNGADVISDTKVYDYVYNGSSLSYLTVTTNRYGAESADPETLYFGNGTVTYNGTVYYYVTNLQGDVVAIIDADGNPKVQYTYDAWGKILSISGPMADTLGTATPLTYRGYVYDTETDLYYLQSRYYDPAVGRFINADALVSTGQGMLGNNMFTYCLNNPINGADPTGHLFFPIAEKMLEEWLEGDGTNQHYGEESMLSKKLKKQKKFQDIYKNALTKYLAGEDEDSWNSGSVYLGANDDLDLFLAVRRCNYEIVITEERRTNRVLFWESDEIRYVVTITVSDRYDFTEQPWDGVGNILNNIAWLVHVTYDVGEDYDWDAVFTYKTDWQKVN